MLECYNLFSGVELSMRSFFVIYLMYTVARPDPDPYPRGGGQLPNPKSAILR